MTAPSLPEINRSPYVNTPVKYTFRTDDLGNKRPNIEINIPYLTIDGLVEALSDEKQTAYVLEILNDSIYQAVKVQINDEEKPLTKQEDLNREVITLAYLANQPPAERRGGGISKETWEAWAADYLEIMPAATGKKKENVQNAAALFLKKFQPVKTDKPVLAKLKEQLAVYTTATEKLEDFAVCVEFLDKKVDSLLASDSAKLLENL